MTKILGRNLSALLHEALNAGSSKVVPWNLEQAQLPSSSLHAVHAGHGPITLDGAIAVAQREGIGQRFWVGVLSGLDGVWTVAQTAMNKDITDPTRELTVACRSAHRGCR